MPPSKTSRIEILACLLALACLAFSVNRCVGLLVNTEALARSTNAATAGQVGSDMRMWLKAVSDYRESGELYQRPAHETETVASLYAPMTPRARFTPAFHMQLIPLAIIQEREPLIRILRAAMITGYFVACLALVASISRTMQKRRQSRARILLFCLLAGIAATSNYGFQDAVFITNYEIPIFAFLTASFFMLARHPLGAATIIAFLASVKFYPAFMASLLLTTRDKNVMAGFFLSGLCFFALGFFAFGLKENLFYWQDVLPVLLSEKIAPILYNMSFGGAIFRFSQDMDITQVAFQAYRFLLLVLTFILLAKKRRDLARSSAEIFALLMALMLICLPNYWQTYLIMLFPAFCIAIYRVVIQPGTAAIIALLICMASMATDNRSWLEIGAPAWINNSAAPDETGSRILEIARNQGENLALLAFAYHYPWTAALYLLERIKFIVPAILWLFTAREILSPALPRDARPGSADLVKS